MNLYHITHRQTNLKHTLKALIIVAVAAGSIAPLPGYAVKQTGGEYNTMYAGLGAKGYDCRTTDSFVGNARHAAGQSRNARQKDRRANIAFGMP